MLIGPAYWLRRLREALRNAAPPTPEEETTNNTTSTTPQPPLDFTALGQERLPINAITAVLQLLRQVQRPHHLDMDRNKLVIPGAYNRIDCFPTYLDYSYILSAGSKGYCAVKEMLQNGIPGHTIMVESHDLRTIDASSCTDDVVFKILKTSQYPKSSSPVFEVIHLEKMQEGNVPATSVESTSTTTGQSVNAATVPAAATAGVCPTTTPTTTVEDQGQQSDEEEHDITEDGDEEVVNEHPSPMTDERPPMRISVYSNVRTIPCLLPHEYHTNDMSRKISLDLSALPSTTTIISTFATRRTRF